MSDKGINQPLLDHESLAKAKDDRSNNVSNNLLNIDEVKSIQQSNYGFRNSKSEA